MKRVVSYSYFRNANSGYEREKGDSALQYQQFLGLVIRAHHVLWNGWAMRLAHDRHVTTLSYWGAVERMAGLGLLELHPFGESRTLCGETGMLERARPVFESDIDVVVCRDIDIIPAPFDRQSVEEWLESGKAVHVVHWASAHSGVMGGTTSVRAEAFRRLVGFDSLESMIASQPDLTMQKHGDDQHLLNRLLPRFAADTLVHDIHHQVGDMGPACEVRTRIAPFRPVAFPPELVTFAADNLSPGIGLCEEPAPALAFYDSLNLPVMEKIRKCEKP